MSELWKFAAAMADETIFEETGDTTDAQDMEEAARAEPLAAAEATRGAPAEPRVVDIMNTCAAAGGRRSQAKLDGNVSGTIAYPHEAPQHVREMAGSDAVHVKLDTVCGGGCALHAAFG